MKRDGGRTGAADSHGREPMSRERRRQVAIDAAIGLGLAVLVILIVIFSSAVQPGFIYQAF